MLLEHQRTSRARLGDRLFVSKHLARTGLLQPGNQMQQGRLAATRRSNQSHQFTLGELTAEALDDFELPEALVYFFKPELHKIRKSRNEIARQCGRCKRPGTKAGPV